jgi:hypothetical protein
MTDNGSSTLAAKVAALEIVLETLLVDHLAEDADPLGIADKVLKSAFETVQKVRERFGEHPIALKITEAISSLVDRAAKRAAA